MDEETLRKMAIAQYLQGKKPISIYRELGKTKKWFFKWLKRYRSGDDHWYRDLSKAPLSHPNQTAPDASQLIVSIRNDLDDSYGQIGVTAIRWEGKKLGIALPSDSTINRILKRQDLVKKNSLSSERRRVSLFPGIPGHQLYPSGRSRGSQVYQERRSVLFSAYHRSGQSSGFYSSSTQKRRPFRSFSPDSLLENHGRTGFPPIRQRTEFPGQQPPSSISWGSPATLPVDGGRSRFYPSRRALAECVVESFNDTYNRRFFRKQWFRSYLQLRAQSKNFEIFHNRNHRYGYLQGSTPFQFLEEAGFKPLLAPPKFTLPKISYIPDGTISVIRFIRSDRKLDIWGELFQLPQEMVYSYVRAKIITHLHEIQVFHGEDMVITFPYHLPPWIDPNS